MDCTRWNESLTGRLYGEIDPASDEALTEHLDTCADCRQTLDAFQQVRSVLRREEPEVPLVPRIVVLRERFRFRPALIAASLLVASILAGAGVSAGFALGRGRGSAPTEARTTAVAFVPATEELVRREVDRRLAALETSGAISTASKAPMTAAGERPVSASELRAELTKFERRLNGARAEDLDYALAQIAASEVRIGARLGNTNAALRTVALASNPYVNEQ